jgi:hypothetical protein
VSSLQAVLGLWNGDIVGQSGMLAKTNLSDLTTDIAQIGLVIQRHQMHLCLANGITCPLTKIVTALCGLI